jgi:LemA protein
MLCWIIGGHGMKTSHIIVAAVVVAFMGYWLLIYNNVVAMQKEVNDAWSQIQLIYKNRAEATPRLLTLVETHVKGEDTTIDGVNKALETVLQIPQVSVPKSTDQLQQFFQAQQIFSQALNNLLLLAQKYPELSAAPSFFSLKIAFANYDNQLAIARDRYMLAAQNYNSYIAAFPNNLIADNLNYQIVPYYREGSNAPSSNVK